MKTRQVLRPLLHPSASHPLRFAIYHDNTLRLRFLPHVVPRSGTRD